MNEDVTIKEPTNKHSVAFYNVENLFDVFDDPYTDDDDFLPTSEKRWTPKRYKKKLRKISYAISQIGLTQTGVFPAIVGLAEIENNHVLDDLLKTKHLKDKPYKYIHFDSPDERGIDTALLYDTNRFKVRSAKAMDVKLFKDDGSPDHTRDILHVSGFLLGELVHIFVNHWPSRRNGKDESEHKRLTASNVLLNEITSIKSKDEDAKIIVMGDFNDGPANKSIRQITNSGFFNPMETMKSYTSGSLNHNFMWFMFDQILFTTNFFERAKDELIYDRAEIFTDDFLKLFDGKFKGNPYRTYVGKKYKGGYSDHFPVYIILKENT